ncbi:MAG: DUF1905 domain-containing protein [Minisyncoccia bacterium]
MDAREFRMRAAVWPYPGMAAWRFLTLPKKHGVAIKKTWGKHARGWGSLPVCATIGKTSWNTSIFPDKKSGSYLLPLKAAVRKAEQVKDGATLTCTVKIRLYT